MALADLLAGELFGGVPSRDEGVDVGTPFAIVDAVEDAGEVGGAGAEGAVEAEAVLGSLNLAGVGRADGAEMVGESNAALDVADAAEELEAAGMEEGGVERGVGEGGRREQA